MTVYQTVDRELVIIGPPDEPVAEGRLFRRKKVTYTCSCTASNGYGEAVCYPTWDGQSAGCLSMGCSGCELKSSRAALEPTYDLDGKFTEGTETWSLADSTSTDAPPELAFDGESERTLKDDESGERCEARVFSAEEDADFAIRSREIQSYMARLGFREPPLDENGDLVAPEGFVIALDHTGGRAMAYLVPEADARGVGIEIDQSGPVTAKPRARCRCTDRSGRCGWQGAACVGSCDACGITVKH
jgi:hypothetical protein